MIAAPPEVETTATPGARQGGALARKAAVSSSASKFPPAQRRRGGRQRDRPHPIRPATRYATCAAAAPCSPVASLYTTSGLSAAQAISAACDKPRRVRHAFENTGDGGAGRVLGQGGDAVGNVQIRRVTESQHAADGHAALDPLRQGEAELPDWLTMPTAARPGATAGRGTAAKLMVAPLA